MLYLVDTSVWIAHLRTPQSDLIELLKRRQVVMHSCIIGELACGSIPNRAMYLDDLVQLPKAQEASFPDCLMFIERHRLFSKGLGWVDVQILASAALSDAQVFSFDKAVSRYAKSSI